jgi:alpha/beta superfamily hydrolase
MRATTEQVFVPGPAGRIECAIDKPQGPARGIALIAHPHPLYGGTLDNKVVQTLARAFVELGYETWRPNFRGVGKSEGGYDEGRGEVEDLGAVFSHFGAEGKKIVLAGFSFGAAMQARFCEKLRTENKFTPERLLLVGVAVVHFQTPAVPPGTLVIHGEMDETVPLAAVLDWARPQELPIVLVPGAEHFFHHKLPLLRSIVESSWK